MAPPAATDPAAAAAAATGNGTAAAAAAFGASASSSATPTPAPTPSPASSGAAIRQQFLALRTAAIAHPQQLLTLTCYVPPTKVGSVIGRKGQSVLTLQREATKRSGGAPGTVRVTIVGNGTTASGGGGASGGGASGGGPPLSIPHHAQRAQSDPAAPWAPVVVRADPVGAFAAARLLTRDVGGLECMDDVVVDVPIPRSRHASLIGRKGLTIASLSAEHGVRIMVPQKRGGGNQLQPQQPQQQQVLSAQQGGGGGGGGGGGEEMLFPGTEESDTKKSAKTNKGGKTNKAAAKTEDGNQDCIDDDENSSLHREASGAAAAAAGGGASYQSHRPTNGNVVQLEGQLDDVERCLVKVMAIAAGTSTSTGGGGGGGGSSSGVVNVGVGVSSAGGKIKSADGTAADGKEADIPTGAEAAKKMTRAEKLKEKKREKKAKAKAEKEAAAAAAAAAAVTKAKSGDNGAVDVGEAAPEVDDHTGDIPMAIEIKPKGDGEAPVDEAAAAAAKEPKYSFAVVTATDETAHLMPSLRKLQALAKRTGAKIRRRKVDESPGGSGSGGGSKKGGDGNAPADDDDGDIAENEEETNGNGGGGDEEDENEGDEEEEADGEDAEANDDGAPGKQEITITGKTETVKAAISALEDIFGEGGCTYTIDAFKTRKKKNGKRGGHQFRGKKKKKGGPGTKE